MFQQKARDLKGFLFCLSLLFNGLSYSLPQDRKDLVELRADRARLSQKEHQGIYSGHVAFTQGSSTITAAKAITKFSLQNQLILAIIHGSKEQQAHYSSKKNPKEPTLDAYADSIWYYPLQHLIELKGHALVRQGKNSFRAAKISYDTLKQHVLSQSNGKTRTTIILYPDKKTI